MKSNFSACLRITLQYEGDYVDHPKDPGGATNLGITFAVLKAWRKTNITKDDVRALTKDEAAKIYKARYWDKVGGDDLPLGLDLCMFDYGVNSGPARAVKALQRIVGVKADGVMGDDTQAAVQKYEAKVLVEKLCDERLRFVQGLRTWSTFGKGWGRRIASVRRAGLMMVKKVQPPIDDDAAEPTGRARGSDKSTTKETVIGGVVGAGAAAGPVIDAVGKASEAAEAGKGVMDFVTSIGVEVALVLIIVCLVGYIIWQHKKKVAEDEV